jgi:hypothetical protein
MVSKAQFEKIALSFETAVAQLHYNQPSIMVFGKFFTRLRAEDDTIVLAVASMDERDMLLELDPETFTLTDHYRSHPFILARRAKIDAKHLKGMLEQRWRKLAPKKLQRERAAPPAVEPTTKRRKTRKEP